MHGTRVSLVQHLPMQVGIISACTPLVNLLLGVQAGAVPAEPVVTHLPPFL